MWSRAACARTATACASRRSSTTSPPAAISGPSATTAASPTCSPCRTRSPQAIVAAIEPQLYAAENFRAQRKAPDSMDAWDLVMRALSHYWRVTRQDNVVAQALLEKAISIDPNYGQALGVLAASHIFSAHMGWIDMAIGAADRRAGGPGGDPRRQRGSLGAPRAGQRLSVHAPVRRFAGRIRTGARAQSELLAGAGLLRGGAGPIAGAGRKATGPRATRCG